MTIVQDDAIFRKWVPYCQKLTKISNALISGNETFFYKLQNIVLINVRLTNVLWIDRYEIPQNSVEF